MPVVGLGTWEIVGENGLQTLKRAIQIGYRHFDTAEIYHNEDIIGQAIQESGIPREQFFITTKVWTDHYRFNEFIFAVKDSLERLKTDYVDLLLIHRPDGVTIETYRALCTCYEQKKAKNIGVSNYSLEQIKQAPIMLDCNQVDYWIGMDKVEELEWCKERETAIVAARPLGRGKFTENAKESLKWLLDQDGVAVIPKSSTEEHMIENLKAGE